MVAFTKKPWVFTTNLLGSTLLPLCGECSALVWRRAIPHEAGGGGQTLHPFLFLLALAQGLLY